MLKMQEQMHRIMDAKNPQQICESIKLEHKEQNHE